MVRSGIARDSAQQVGRFRQGELLACKTTDKAPATDLPPRFHAPVHIEQLPPRRQPALALQELAEHDAVATQQYTRDVFNRRIAQSRGVSWRSHPPRQAPAPCRIYVDQRPPIPPQFFASLPGRDQRTYAGERVRRDPPTADQFAQPLFHVAPQKPRVVHEVVEERGAMLAQAFQDLLRTRGESFVRVRTATALLPMPQCFPLCQNNRRRTYRTRRRRNLAR